VTVFGEMLVACEIVAASAVGTDPLPTHPSCPTARIAEYITTTQPEIFMHDSPQEIGSAFREAR